jgi:hypothetical protein
VTDGGNVVGTDVTLGVFLNASNRDVNVGGHVITLVIYVDSLALKVVMLP